LRVVELQEAVTALHLCAKRIFIGMVCTDGLSIDFEDRAFFKKFGIHRKEAGLKTVK
jgi:hypothetical protein